MFFFREGSSAEGEGENECQDESGDTKTVNIENQQSTTTTTSTSTNTNRRTKLFKSNRRPTNQTTRRYDSSTTPLVHKIYTQDYAFHRGFFLKIGDIVALRRHRSSHHYQSDSSPQATEPSIYFAQIRAFLCNQYGEKSAVITWLIPANQTSADMINAARKSLTPPRQIIDFDLECFALGPSEELPRPLDSLEFVARPDSVATAGLVSRSDSFVLDDVYNRYDYLNQYKCDMLRHKFDLEDLAAANFRIVTSKIVMDDSSEESNGGQRGVGGGGGVATVKHEFVMSN